MGGGHGEHTKLNKFEERASLQRLKRQVLWFWFQQNYWHVKLYNCQYVSGEQV